jgi:hypothetical protein
MSDVRREALLHDWAVARKAMTAAGVTFSAAEREYNKARTAIRRFDAAVGEEIRNEG